MISTKGVAQRSKGTEPGAVRLTFSYEGDSVELIKEQALEMIAFPSDELKYQEETSGFWIEVSDEEGQLIYRRVSENPIRFYAEVRSDNPDRPLAMQDVEGPQGIFTILIPDLTDAREVALFSSPLSKGERMYPAVEIARFELQSGKDRKEV